MMQASTEGRLVRVCAAAAMAAACVIAAPAAAEKTDRDKPINVVADTSTLDDLNKVSVLEGNVIITQGTMVIRANKVVMKQLPDGTQTATAYGNPVAMRQKRDGVDEYVEAYAKRVEYNDRSELVQLFDDAHVISGKNDVRNVYIAYNMSTEQAEAKCPPGTQCDQRVKLTIQPGRKPAPGPDGKPAPAPAPAAPPAGAVLKPADDLKKPPSN
jgi:lipopolysaccharide export system protein LptA